ncbi:MAG: acetylesterase [Erysipelotrichaceae bacterium]|nr:acetylesterase [Erysipelotrichaceae bacterium]
MALLQVNYLSKSLCRLVPLNVVLPSDKMGPDRSGYILPKDYRFKTLYLMHGLFGNYTGWITNTRIQRWAEDRNLAVVMPSGDNSFYVNGITGNNDYGEFIGHELVEITRKMFPLSDKREDTFIGGLSMGGFGALRNGLKYSDTFSHIIALSSAIHMFEYDATQIIGENSVFGDLKEAAKSDKNPEVVLKQLVDSGKEKPRIYMSCGTEDTLLDSNRRFRDLLLKNGFDLEYHERPGAHTWDYWDAEILPFLDWLPLEEAFVGAGDGNVQGTNKNQ